MAFVDIQDPVKREQIVQDYIKKHTRNQREKRKSKTSWYNTTAKYRKSISASCQSYRKISITNNK